MDPRRNNTPAPEAVTVTASTLEEAYRRVRASFGDEAVILETRSVMRPGSQGLRLERMVELTVARDTRPTGHAAVDTGLEQVALRLEEEIVRLEARMAELQGRVAVSAPVSGVDADDATDGLVRLGTSRETAERLVARHAAESPVEDFRDWLTGQIRTADCSWAEVDGLHAVVGLSGSGRTRLVLAAAARVASAGAPTLVLSVAPRHPGEVRRLQIAAAEGDFDAAVIRRPEQIVELAGHISDYRTVLVDLPGLDDPALVRGSELHSWLAGHHGMHRHLLVPQDLDPADWDHLTGDARSLNCDWLALGRLDRTRRPGKFLDLIEAIPLPVSLLAGSEPALIADRGSLGELLGPVGNPGKRVVSGENAS
jgi:flagellar biosynthesis GTPase FlhF